MSDTVTKLATASTSSVALGSSNFTFIRTTLAGQGGADNQFSSCAAPRYWLAPKALRPILKATRGLRGFMPAMPWS